MAIFNFNASNVEPMQSRSFDPLPNGDYEMIVTKSDVKPTKAGTGHYLEAEMQVVSGEYSGRRHWERYNIDNPNKQAEDIAKAALAGLCMSVGKPDINDSAELHDIPFVASIEIDRKDPTRNRIVGYTGLSSGPVINNTKPAAAPAVNKKPWE